MGGSDSLSGAEPPATSPSDDDELPDQIQALADFIRNLKDRTDRVLGQPQRDRAAEDRESLRETSAQWGRGFSAMGKRKRRVR
jgi:hypothetical protein